MKQVLIVLMFGLVTGCGFAPSYQECAKEHNAFALKTSVFVDGSTPKTSIVAQLGQPLTDYENTDGYGNIVGSSLGYELIDQTSGVRCGYYYVNVDASDVYDSRTYLSSH